MSTTDKMPVINIQELLIDKFLAHKRIAPEARIDFILACKDVLSACDAETGWSLLEEELYKRPYLLAVDRTEVPYELAEAAFGSAPSLRARGELLKAIGQDAYTHTARLWGATASNLRPGKPPTTDDNIEVRMSEAPKPAADAADSGNPYSPNWKGDDAARNAAIAKLIRGLGSKAAAKMAAAGNCDIAGRPLRK